MKQQKMKKAKNSYIYICLEYSRLYNDGTNYKEMKQ